MILLLVWAVTTLLVSLFIRYRASVKHQWDLAAKLPGPRPWPIIGNSYLFLGVKDSEGILKRLWKAVEKYDLVKLWQGHKLIITIRDSKVIAKILSGQKALYKTLFYEFFKDWSYGVFISNGKTWRELRGMLNQTMRHNMLEDYMPSFNKKAIDYCNRLAESCGKFIDPLQDSANLLIDLSLYTHWGVEANEFNENRSNLTEFSERLFETSYKRGINFFLQFNAIYKRHEDYRELQTLGQEVYRYLTEKVNERKQLIEKEQELAEGDPNKRKKVYLDMVMEWASSEGIGKDPHKIIRIAADILIGAADTTSVTICQMFYHMALDPEIQRKMHNEIDDIFRDDPKRLVTREDLRNMKYTEMVMNETLRHYCPPNAGRLITEDLPTDHGVLPKGAFLTVLLFMIHKDPRSWEKPYDFYPDHFLPEAVAKRPRTAFMPFMTGPRSCPGKSYAYMVIKVIMAHVLRRFRVETDMKKDMKLKFAVMVSPKDGYSLKFIPRTAVH